MLGWGWGSAKNDFFLRKESSTYAHRMLMRIPELMYGRLVLKELNVFSFDMPEFVFVFFTCLSVPRVSVVLQILHICFSTIFMFVVFFHSHGSR